MKVTRRAQSRLASMEMFVLDVDGVLTQGEIIYTDAGQELKSFDVRDGLGLRVAGTAGLRLALISGRTSSIVQRRARDLRIEDVVLRTGDKENALRMLISRHNLSLEHVAYMGDDLNDRAPMRVAGLAIAPADAVPEILEEADIVTDAPGGRGAARQAVELILRAQGKWESAVERYLAELGEQDQARRPVEAEPIR